MLITAEVKIRCPVCRSQVLDFQRVQSRLFSVPGYAFFCPSCNASAQVSQAEINQCDQDGGFNELLRARLVSTIGRADKLEPHEEQAPKLQVREPSKPRQLKKPRARVAPAAPDQQLPVRLSGQPSSKVRRVLNLRKALRRALSRVVRPDDSS